MKYEDLPQRWKTKIIEYLRSKGEGKRTQLSAYDFSLNQKVKLTFEDESFAEFKYAFVIEAPELGEIGVFTEHCGYHIFYSGGTLIKISNKE